METFSEEEYNKKVLEYLVHERNKVYIPMLNFPEIVFGERKISILHRDLMDYFCRDYMA